MIFGSRTPKMARLPISRFLLLFPILFSAFGCATPTHPTFPNTSVNCREHREEVRDLCLRLADIDPDVAVEVNKLPEFQGEIGDLQIRALERFAGVLANASYAEAANLNSFLNAGFPKIRKYSAHLQAIFWVLEKDDDEKILTYSLGTLLDKAWDFSDSRWDDYETVTDRLNTPRLIDYFQRRRFAFVPYPEHPWNPRRLFETHKGSCIEFTMFALVCLKKAGYKAAAYHLPWKSDESPGFHEAILFKRKNGQFYVMDNGRPDPKGLISFAQYYMERY